MNQGKQYRTVGAAVCLPPGWEVVQQPSPSIDDRIGKVATEAMDEILKLMHGERDAEVTMESIDRIATQYVAARWHITQGHGK